MPDATSLLAPGAAQLRILSHPARLRLLQLLRKPGERLSVNYLSTAANLAQSVTSQHLAALKRGRILKAEREGHNVFYSLAAPWAAQVLALMEKQL